MRATSTRNQWFCREVQSWRLHRGGRFRADEQR